MSPDFNSHIHSLDLVFDRLLKSGMKLKPAKCNLFRRELKFFGHVVTADGIKCDTGKTEVIKEWKIPTIQLITFEVFLD